MHTTAPNTPAPKALRRLFDEPLAVVMVPALRPRLPDVPELASWSAHAAACTVLLAPRCSSVPFDDRTLRALAAVHLPPDFRDALVARLHPDNLAVWVTIASATNLPLIPAEPQLSDLARTLASQHAHPDDERAVRPSSPWTGSLLLNWLWWFTQSTELDVHHLPTQAQDGALTPLLLFRTIIALGGLRSPDRRTEQLTRYIAARARDEHDRALLSRWAENIGTAQVPDDALGTTLFRLLQLQLWNEASTELQHCASQTREPLLRMAWLVCALLLCARQRPYPVHRALELASECWRAAGDAGSNGIAVQSWAVRIVDALAALDPKAVAQTAAEMTPSSITPLLCRAPFEPESAASVARTLAQLICPDDTPAMVDAWADVHSLQAWAIAIASDDRTRAAQLESTKAPRWRSLLESVANELLPASDDTLDPQWADLLKAGQWSDPRWRSFSPSANAAFYRGFWQGVRKTPRGALAFVAPLLSAQPGNVAAPDDLPASTYRAWLEEWLLTSDRTTAESSQIRSWVFSGAVTLGASASWDIARAIALHRGDRLIPLLTALAAAPDPGVDVVLRSATAVVVNDADRAQLYELLLSRWSADADTPPDAMLVRAAQGILESEPRHRIALHIGALAAESDGAWEQAVALWERLARLTNDPQKRARLYLRMAKLLEERLQNPNAAMENVIVSFICAPWDPESLAWLEKRYRSQRRFRDLVSSYTAASESLVERGEPKLASELLARRAQVELQGLDAPEQAAASLVDAIRLNPAALNLVMLLEQHVAPRAGAHWVQRGREAAGVAGG